jgi:hypothetical protein
MSISITLTSAPTPPTRDDPDNFRTRADNYVDWQANTHVDEMNTVIADINATIQNLWVGTSTTSVTIGTGEKTFTVAEDNLAFGAGSYLRIADASDPSSNYMIGVVTSYDKDTKELVVYVADTTGSGTISDWSITLEGATDISRIAVWSDLTGALTVPFIVSHDGDYWSLKEDIADVTAEEPGVSTKWRGVGISEYEEFTSSGTWNKNPGATWVYVEAIGGGGGGSNTTGTDEDSGGTGGEFTAKLFRASEVSSSETVTIGAGGSGRAAGDSGGGSDGGETSFGTLVTSRGGPGGTGSHLVGPGMPGAGVSNSIDKSNAFVFPQAGTGGYDDGAGRNTIYGGAGGGSASASGGTSTYGGDGGDGDTTADTKAGNGSVPGGGGGGSSNDGGGGDGGDGRVRVWQW